MGWRYGKALLVSGLLGLSTVVRADITNGLVAYYPFNGNANDESGNGLNATVQGAVLTTNRFGITNSAYYLGGSAYLRLPTLSFGSNFTISAWFSYDTFSGRQWQRVFDFGNGAGIDNIILCQPSNTNRIGFELDNGVGGNTRIEYAVNLQTGRFYHATCVFSNAADMRLYLNGHVPAQAQIAVIYRQGNRTNNFLGRSNWGSDSLLKGALDDIRIYNRALSSDEVDELYSVEAALTNPVVLLDPQAEWVPVGNTATLSIMAGGAPRLSLQWRKDANPLAGRTDSTLTIANAATNDSGGYDVVITNSYGSVTSLVAKLSVGYPPAIVVQPQSCLVAAGSNVTFSVVATGDLPIGYQWRYNDAGISGATSDSYAVTGAQPFNSGSYSVVVSNVFAAVSSSAATLTVVAPPAITSQPQGQNAYKGAAVLLSAGVNGTAPVFQWFKGGFPMPGQTNATLLFKSVQTSDNGSYWMSASNFAGVVTTDPVQLSIVDANVRFVTVWANGQMITDTESWLMGPVVVELTTIFTNGDIYYTLDGSSPDYYSVAYAGPLTLTNAATLRAIGYSADYLQAGYAGPFTINLLPAWTLNLANRGGGTVAFDPPLGPYLTNSIVTIVATPAPGFSLLQWLGDVTGNSLSNSLLMNGPKRIEAVFGTTLGTTVAGNGAVYLRPPGGIYPYGTQIKLHAIPGVGSYFSFWGNAGSGTNNPLTITLTNPAPTVASVFSPLSAGQHALGVLPEGLGRVTVSPNLNRYTSGQAVTITATADANQKFLGWSGDAGGVSSPVSVTMNQSRTITGNFTRNPGLSITNTFEGLQPGGFCLTLFGQYEDSFDIQASTNLRDWTTLATLTNSFGRTQFADSSATNYASRLYRATAPK
jgi:hypothetical protein